MMVLLQLIIIFDNLVSTMELKASTIVGIVIGLLLLGIMLPIGLAGLEAFTSTNADIETLVATVIPIVAVVGIIMLLIPKREN